MVTANLRRVFRLVCDFILEMNRRLIMNQVEEDKIAMGMVKVHGKVKHISKLRRIGWLSCILPYQEQSILPNDTAETRKA